MRLRKNRDEYIHLLREYEEAHPELVGGADDPEGTEGPAGAIGGDAMMPDDAAEREGDEDEVRRALDGSQFDLNGMDPEREGASDAVGAEGAEGGTDGDGAGMDVVGESLFPQNWDGHGQSLLEVVDAAAAAQEAEAREARGAQRERQHQRQAQSSGPGGLEGESEGDAVEDMKRVFGLDGDRETIAT